MLDIKDREIIKIQVKLLPADSEGNPERLHFIWIFPKKDGQFDYDVEYDIFKNNVRDIRTCLSKLVAKIGEEQKKGNYSLDCREEIRCIAIEGHRLYNNLFDSYKDVYKAVKKIKTLLSDLDSSKVRIEFINLNKKIDMPWGLIFDSNPYKLDSKDDILKFTFFFNFWCNKYLVSTIPCLLRPFIDNEPIKANKFDSTYIIDEEILKENMACFSPEELAIYNYLKDNFMGVSYYIEEFRAKLGKMARKYLYGLIYLYGHTDGKRARIKSKKTNKYEDLEASNLKDFISSIPLNENEQNYIWFFNGCDSALTSDNYDLSALATYRMFNGFIGTESILPKKYALKFGLEFLYYFLIKGESIGDIFYRLNRDHWPLSLLYSINCHPSICIEPRDVTILQNMCEKYEKENKLNFCLSKVI